MTLTLVQERFFMGNAQWNSHCCLACEEVFHVMTSDPEPEFCPFCGEGPGESTEIRFSESEVKGGMYE